MKLVPLTQGQNAIVDDDVFELVSKFKWYAWWNKSTRSFYAVRNAKMVRGKRGPSIYMHKFIVGPSAISVDHWNHDTLDNQRDNLRPCTTAQNAQNRRLQSNNTTGFHGVVWDKDREKWRSQIQTSGRMKNLGRFESIAEAVHAYNIASEERHGKFGVRNAL